MLGTQANIHTAITCASPGEKEQVSAQYIIINMRISREFSHVLPHSTTPNHSFPVRSITKVRTERFNPVRVRTLGYYASTSLSIARYKFALMSKR